MSEMIERVAKALYLWQEGKSDWDAAEPESKEDAREAARAAIEAMREPTEDMKQCSEEIHWNYSCHVCGGLTEGWHKMIDHALTP